MPTPVSDDPEIVHLEKDYLNSLLSKSRERIIAGDCSVLREQEEQFALYSCMIIWQRGFRANSYASWYERLNSREVVETAEHFYERHGDVRLRIDLGSSEFDLCRPKTRAREHWLCTHTS